MQNLNQKQLQDVNGGGLFDLIRDVVEVYDAVRDFVDSLGQPMVG